MSRISGVIENITVNNLIKHTFYAFPIPTTLGILWPFSSLGLPANHFYDGPNNSMFQAWSEN
jgi:hypothetical protein